MTVLVLEIDQYVRLRGDLYVVRGLAPMGAAHRHVHLENIDTGEHLDADVDAIRAERVRCLTDLENLGFSKETSAILAEVPVPLASITNLLLPEAA